MALIVKVGADIKNFQREFRKLTRETQTVGETLTSVGSGLTKGVTLPILAIGGASAALAIQFESDFAGVRKTVDATEDQFAELSQGIRDMAKAIPASTTEINGVAEAAGQLGIEVPNILSFTKTMVELGTATNLSSEDAASSLAKFANVTKMSQTDFDKLGSVIVDLGNNFATTEADIVEMGMRLSGAGTQIGMSQAEIMGLATALSSVGIEAEMGGSAISKIMVNMQVAAKLGLEKMQDLENATGMTRRELELLANHDGESFKALAIDLNMTTTEMKKIMKAGKDLEGFAAIAGMTGEQFKQAFEKDAVGALQAFINGLGDAENKGSSAIELLDEMGIKEVRLRDSLLRAANANDLFSSSIDLSNKAWDENTALTKEAETRFGTTASQLIIAKNKIKDVGIELGNNLIPALAALLKAAEPAIKVVSDGAKKFSEMNDKSKRMALGLVAAAAATGPLLMGFGKVIITVGKVKSTLAVFSAMKTARQISAITASAAGMTQTMGSLTPMLSANAGMLSTLTTTAGGATGGLVGLGGAFGSTLLALAPWALGIGAVGLAIYGLHRSFEDSKDSVTMWGTEVPTHTAKVLGDIKDLNSKATGEFNLMSNGLSGNTQSMVDDFTKIGQSIESDLKAKIEGLDGVLKGLPDAVKGAMEKIVNQEKERVNEHLAIIEENNKRVQELQKAADASETGMTIEQSKRIKDITLASAKEYLEVAIQSKQDREKILSAMTGDVEAATMEQAESWAVSLGKQRQAITVEYSQAKSDLEKKLKEMGYAMDSDVAKNMFKTLDQGSQDATKSIEEQLSKIAEKYPEVADKILFANGQVVSSTQAQSTDVRAANKRIINSYEELGEEVTNNLDLVSDESTEAGKMWNSLVFDEKTGTVKSNAQEVITEASKSTEGWKNMKFMIKEADLTSNAKMVIAEAAIQNGHWWEMSWGDKKALIESNSAQVVIKALEDRDIWWNLDFKTQQALLKSDTPEKVQEALVNVGLWNDMYPEVKDLFVKNEEFMQKFSESQDQLREFNGLTPELKSLYVNTDGATPIIRDANTVLEEYENLTPELKNLLGDNTVLKEKIYEAMEATEIYNQIGPANKNLLADNSDINLKIAESKEKLGIYNYSTDVPTKNLKGDNTDVKAKVTNAQELITTYNANNPASKYFSSQSNAPATKTDLEGMWGAWGKIENSEKTLTTRHRSIFEKIGDAIAGNAKGTDYFQGGLTAIHEKGDEVINLPQGAQILTAGLSNQMMAQYGKNMARNDTARLTRQVAANLSISHTSSSTTDLRRVEGLLQRLVAKEPVKFGMDAIGRIADNFQGRKMILDSYQGG